MTKPKPKQLHLKRGRRPLEPEARLTTRIAFSASIEDRERVYAHCEKLDVVPAEWIRGLVFAEIQRGNDGR
jgi:hypothetical protein